MTTALLFLASVVILVIAAELFTNAIEWAGYRLRIGAGATGSLLAALGTSLPETIVPVVALATHAPAADSVAIGSVLGAPFLLLTVGSAVTGVAVLSRRERRVLVLPRGQPRRDLGVFLCAFPLALAAVLFPYPARIAVGVILLALYVAYVTLTLRSGTPETEMPEPLHIVRWRPGPPHLLLVAAQLVAAIVLLVVGSQLFVSALDRAAAALHTSALLLALVIVPLATELPETLNSILWVRSFDDSLAFGNIAGSAAFQACVLAFIGVTFTSWSPGRAGLIGAGLTVVTAALLLLLLRDGRAGGRLLALAILPWMGYVVAAVVTGGHLGG